MGDSYFSPVLYCIIPSRKKYRITHYNQIGLYLKKQYVSIHIAVASIIQYYFCFTFAYISFQNVDKSWARAYASVVDIFAG